MIRYLIFSVLIMVCSPAYAQNSALCQELWLSRNTVLDRAGQCFMSLLGQAVFDNTSCTEGDIRLNPLDAEIVRMAQELEAWAACAVDTEARQLSREAQQFQQRLTELFTVPVRADTEHGCIGYFGAPIALHTGISTSMTVLGSVEPGQRFSMSHQPMRGGWEYLEVSDEQGTPIAHGWAQDPPSNLGDVCELAAG